MLPVYIFHHNYFSRYDFTMGLFMLKLNLVLILLCMATPSMAQIQTLMPENLNYFPPDYLKDRCETSLKAPIPTHHVTNEHLNVDYWLKQWQKYHDLNHSVLKSSQIDLHTQSLVSRSTSTEPITWPRNLIGSDKTAPLPLGLSWRVTCKPSLLPAAFLV